MAIERPAGLNENLHFDIGTELSLHHSRGMSREITKKAIETLGNYDNIDSETCRGMRLSTDRREGESEKNYWSRAETMNVWVVKSGSDSSKLLIEIDAKFNHERFIEIFTLAMKDEYNEKNHMVTFSTEDCNEGKKILSLTIEPENELVIFELFKKLLLSSAAFTGFCKPLVTNQEFERDLDTLFGIDSIKRRIQEDTLERLFVANNFDAVYEQLLPGNMAPSNKGKFLDYGKRLRWDGNYAEAIRFLNAENPVHKETHDAAQMEIFDTLGDILAQDKMSPFLEEAEKRQYQSNRIELANRLEVTNPALDGLADKLFCEYAGFEVIGRTAPFSLKADPIQLALQLANELYKARMQPKE